MRSYQELVKQLYASNKSSFYRTYWGDLPDHAAKTPILTAEVLSHTPFIDRTYGSDQGMVKSVTTKDSVELFIKRTFADITSDHLPVPAGSRVLVLTSNSDEALEHSLWCYEHGSIPYHGDAGNVEVAVFCAEHFRTTVLITDKALFTSLTEQSLIPSSVELVIIADQTPVPSAGLTVEQILYLPEAGCLGSVTETNNGFKLTSADNVVAEIVDDQLVVTKVCTAMPLIRYKTSIAAHADGDTVLLQ